MPDEKRVALDLLDVRESIEQMGDQIRWIPTDHMLVDCMTKNMPCDAMLHYLKNMEYAFKYDDVIKNTKRAIAKERKTAREKKAAEKLKQLVGEEEEETCTDVNVVSQYRSLYDLWSYLYSTPQVHLTPYTGDFDKLVQEVGYRQAYLQVADCVCAC